MALWEDIFGESVAGTAAGGLVIGVGALVLGPILLSAVGWIARPLIKTVVKAGITVYEKGREAMDEASKGMGAIIEESRADLADAGAAPAPAESKEPAETAQPRERGKRPGGGGE